MKKIKFLSIILLFFVLVSSAFGLEVPELTNPIVDNASLISDGVETNINNKLEELSNSTGIQLGILTIPTLEGEVLESYSMKVVENWKLGSAEKDTGVLLLIALEERSIRIEVGYGLEGILTDTKCGLIIRNVITPHFKNGDYSTGIVQGVTAIVENVASDFSENSESPIILELDDEDSSSAIVAIFFMFMIAILASAKNKTSVGTSGNSTLKNVVIAKTALDIAKSLTSSNNNNSGFGGSSFGGGFGGFSGGGGSFGGGGASGKW
jgi:uncharacterized protein